MSSKIDLPKEWDYLLNNNIVILTGVGKSGLSWFVSLFCSLRPTYHLYGPVLFKAIPPKMTKEQIDLLKPILQATLLYDYCIPKVRGIYLCDDPQHAMYQDWFWASSAEHRLEVRRDNLNSFSVLDRIGNERPLFVADLCDALPRQKSIKAIFPGCHFLNIVRNGLDIVNLRVSLNWDTTAIYNRPAGPIFDWLVDDIAPWYIEPEALKLWKDWKLPTRAAHIWRVQVNHLQFYQDDDACIKYEDMMQKPEVVIGYIQDRFRFLRETRISKLIVKRLKIEGIKVYDKITIDDIEEPERAKFKRTMKAIGYL